MDLFKCRLPEKLPQSVPNHIEPACSRWPCLITLACITLGLFLQLSFPSQGLAKGVLRCYLCGMDAAKSQTEFVVHFDDKSDEHTCCFHCLYLLKKFIKDRKVVRVETRDFSDGALADAKKAYFLEGSSLIPKGSMAPFLLAFKEKETAEKYRAKHGGTVVNFDRAWDIVVHFDEEVAPIK